MIANREKIKKNRNFWTYFTNIEPQHAFIVFMHLMPVDNIVLCNEYKSRALNMRM